MIIIVKNKDTLLIDDFKFKCSIGKKGVYNKKIEGDLTTPKGIFNLGNIYYESYEIKWEKEKAYKFRKTKWPVQLKKGL